MRPIDADALLENTKAYFGDCIDKQDSEIIDNTILAHNKNISKIIEEAPTVVRPRGEWEEEILEIIEHTKMRISAVNGLYADGALTKDHAIECKIKILDLLLKELEDEIDYQAVIPKEVTE